MTVVNMKEPPRLAIISTYDQLCGIAAYTRALVPLLRPHLDVTVFELDQSRLRSENQRIQHIADAQVKEIARQLAKFDFVNIQLEFGTLGRTPRQMLRRLRWLAKAAPKLSVTFHTVPRPRGFRLREAIVSLIGRQDRRRAAQVSRNDFAMRRLAKVYPLLARMQSVKPTHILVHNRADRQFIEDAYGLHNVHDHPLAFHLAEEAAKIRVQASRRSFQILDGIDRDAKLIGTFGFLSAYKGIETAIKALQLLPPDYHLLIFGGVHPNNIEEFQSVDRYTKTLLATASDGSGVQERVHFMGAPDDDAFVQGMAIRDAIVLPYIEVGQTSSGSLSQAVELGRRVLAARTSAFMEFGSYHPGAVEYFDIGNHFELASRIRNRPAFDLQQRQITYDARSNANLYRTVHGAGPSVTEAIRPAPIRIVTSVMTADSRG